MALAGQIQRRFPQYLGSSRTTRRHLLEMESLGYLATVPTGGFSVRCPKVYCCTGRGVRRIRKALAAKGKNWEPGRVERTSWHKQVGLSANHIVHEVMTTEFLLGSVPKLPLDNFEKSTMLGGVISVYRHGGHCDGSLVVNG